MSPPRIMYTPQAFKEDRIEVLRILIVRHQASTLPEPVADGFGQFSPDNKGNIIEFSS